MSLEPGWILLELLVGGIGYVIFTYGRKQERLPQLVAGLLVMVYPYFVTSLVGLLAGGVLLLGGLWYAVAAGW